MHPTCPWSSETFFFLMVLTAMTVKKKKNKNPPSVSCSDTSEKAHKFSRLPGTKGHGSRPWQIDKLVCGGWSVPGWVINPSGLLQGQGLPSGAAEKETPAGGGSCFMDSQKRS